MQGIPIEIQYAPELPLALCDKKHCMCIHLAREGPRPSVKDMTESKPEWVGKSTRLTGMNRRTAEREKEGPGMMIFAGIMIALLLVILSAAALWPVAAAGVFWALGFLVMIGLLAGIFVRLGRR